MAYMSQEKKALIVAELKRIIPKSWKYSVGVRHHSTLVLNLWSAPFDLVGEYTSRSRWNEEGKRECIAKQHVDINPYHWRDHFEGELLALFTRIFDALNGGNHDRSDLQTDYFDVGWYVDVNVGAWNKPFVNTAQRIAEAA